MTPDPAPLSSLIDAAYSTAIRPALFRVGGGDPEVAHEQTLAVVRRLPRIPGALAVIRRLHERPQQKVEMAGLTFPGPVGLAAGLDKYGVGTLAWGALGFSHVELGTVTARPQPGNPRPRLFRLKESQAIINRMGFNNPGADALAARLAQQGIVRGNGAAGIPVGVSLGKTKLTPLADAVGDYLYSLEKVAGHADYVAINVSSPNTPGLRGLQDAAALRELTTALTTRAAELSPDPVPLFVKVAPDLDDQGLDDVLEVCADTGVAGLIATNTTLGREGLAASDLGRAGEAGGLSGAPLTRRALEVVRYVTARTALPVIGAGGIMAAADAQAMWDAGARMVQVYSGYIYRGPALVNEINRIVATTQRTATSSTPKRQSKQEHRHE